MRPSRRTCSPSSCSPSSRWLRSTYALQLVTRHDRTPRRRRRARFRPFVGLGLERMPAVDRCILRIATYELISELDVPVAVVIDEAVELAKEYSTEDSPRFVNGVLAAIADTVRPEASPPSGIARRRRPARRPSDRGAYGAAGVDYDTLDAAKRLAIAAAAATLALPSAPRCHRRRRFPWRAGHARSKSAGSPLPSCSNASGPSR